ncbi:MAG: bifunctional folylpolyglutamate synthase/dihydrofolate synthase [Bdellovibrionales bacterium]|nr:bifunctional folylpolyglutamate synthase/dihydrofolate synthase [Bdellovibrionales bacterium]
MAAVMRHFDLPQDNFPSIHIAGTNGKGSVVALTSKALIDAGHRVGTYTSPHLVSMTERFQVNGRLISEKDLDRWLGRVRRVFPHLTQFEVLTAVAFLWFSEQAVDIAVVEVGLGGRLDATNVMRRVLVSVITTIDYDHTEWLGNTVAKIAREKAGIIKPFVPVVTATSGTARRVIQSVARLKQAPFVVAKPSHFKLSLQGAYQQQNAATAQAALEQLRGTRFELTSSEIRKSFATARWPGRFEQIGAFILDGAHNVAGCRALVTALKQLRRTPVTLMFGVLKGKDISGMVRVLEPVVKQCFVVPIKSERSTDPQRVAAMPEWKGKATAVGSLDEGYRRIKNTAGKHLAVIAGSLYLVGAMRDRLQKETL